MAPTAAVRPHRQDKAVHSQSTRPTASYPLILAYIFAVTLANRRHLRNNAGIMRCTIVTAIRGLVGVASFLAGLTFSAGAHAQGKLDASYSISLLGLTIGKGAWTIEIANDQYSEKADGRISGVASTLISGEVSASTRGSFANDHAQPAAFDADVKTSAETEKIKMTFDTAGISDLVVDPPFPASPNQERVPVTDSDRKGVLDPLSAGLVSISGSDDVLKPESCQRRIPVFDGRRRFDVALSFKRMDKVKVEGGYQGPAIVCAIQVVPISGHRVAGTAMQRLVKSNAVEVTLAPLAGTRVLVPFSASVPTLVGTVSITADKFVATGPAVPAAGTSRSQ
jgi:Protein of unknown function (DUF3108)